MNSSPPSAETWLRQLPYAAFALMVVGGIVTWMRFGAPAVVLWFAFGALTGAILLFWESLRAVLGTHSTVDESSALGDARIGDLELKKRAALRALKDVEFEHSIHRMSDEDYEALCLKYRGDARAAMEAMDKGFGPYLSEAEALIEKASRRDDPAPETHGSATAPSDAPNVRAVCSACATTNDTDAVFCKKCGARMAAA